jgi:hypothetical protein
VLNLPDIWKIVSIQNLYGTVITYDDDDKNYANSKNNNIMINDDDITIISMQVRNV